MNSAKDVNSLLNLFASGCDERIFINMETNKNRYQINPFFFEDLCFRGSCTCGALNPLTLKESLASLRRINGCSKDKENWSEEQRSRLKKFINSPKDNYDVFFGSSGSDLMFYPVLFNHMISERNFMINIVSCSDEIGVGSKLASECKIFSKCSPFGSKIEKGKKILPFIKINTLFLNARNTKGYILKSKIKELSWKYTDCNKIINLVYGSKSGIFDNIELINNDLNTLWTVDLCQFRVDQKLIHYLIEKKLWF